MHCTICVLLCLHRWHEHTKGVDQLNLVPHRWKSSDVRSDFEVKRIHWLHIHWDEGDQCLQHQKRKERRQVRAQGLCPNGPQDCRPKLPTTTTSTILDALQTLSQHFPNASIHYTNHNLKPPHPILYKTKTRGLLHNNPCLNGLQAFSKLSKIIPVNFPTAILEVHFMRPKLPEIWFNKIGLTTEKSDIRASAINEKSVNLPLAKYLLAHIRPKIVQRLQPPKTIPRQWWWKPT